MRNGVEVMREFNKMRNELLEVIKKNHVLDMGYFCKSIKDGKWEIKIDEYMIDVKRVFSDGDVTRLVFKSDCIGHKTDCFGDEDVYDVDRTIASMSRVLSVLRRHLG